LPISSASEKDIFDYIQRTKNSLSVHINITIGSRGQKKPNFMTST